MAGKKKGNFGGKKGEEKSRDEKRRKEEKGVKIKIEGRTEVREKRCK